LGFAVTEIAVAQLKQTLAVKQPILNGTLLAKPSVGTTEETSWKTNIDFTEIDYLNAVLKVRGTQASKGRLRLYIDGVKRIDQTEGADEEFDNHAYFTVDCTSISGENELKITLDNDNANGHSWAYCYIFARDS
jgi:hypothetical protein